MALAQHGSRQTSRYPSWLKGVGSSWALPVRKASIVFLGAGIAVRSFGLDHLAIGSTCPLLRFTGVPCPLCGGTRAVAALFDAQFSRSIAFNPAVIVIALIGALAWAAPNVTARGTAWLRLNFQERRNASAWITVLIVCSLWIWQLARLAK